MEKLVRAMTALIACEVCGGQIDGTQYAFSDEELARLYKLSKAHDLAHLVGDALLKNNLVGNAEIRAKFEKQILLAVYRCEKMRCEAERLYKALNAAEIPFIPLKGAVLRGYYPEPWMRTSCDIDILVRETDAEAAAAVLTGEYGYAYRWKSSHDLSLFSPDNVHVELHYDLVEDGCANAAAEVLKDIWSAAVLCDGSACRYEMPDAYFCFYHIAHMAKHLENGGCGIRPFLDLWILDSREKTDAEARERLLRQGGLLGFAEAARRLCRVWFENAACDPLSRQLEAYILRGGVYGSSENRIAVQQQKTGGRVGYVLSKIWIPYDVIKFHYPVLQKHRWLMPLMEVRRWGKLLFCGHLKRVAAEMRYNSRITETQAADMREFLKRIGL